MPKKPTETMGQRIAQARRELAVRLARDVLQSDVANELGVGAATVSRWEADQAAPRDEALNQLAAYLKTTPAWLKFGVGAPSTAPKPGAVEVLRSETQTAARERGGQGGKFG